jgi:hypothetical protein
VLRLQRLRNDLQSNGAIGPKRADSCIVAPGEGALTAVGKRFDLKLLGDSIACMRSLIWAPEGTNAWGQRPLSWRDLGSGTAGGRDGPYSSAG